MPIRPNKPKRRGIGGRPAPQKRPRLKLQVARVLTAIDQTIRHLEDADAVLSVKDKEILKRVRENLGDALVSSVITPADLQNVRRIARKLGARL